MCVLIVRLGDELEKKNVLYGTFEKSDNLITLKEYFILYVHLDRTEEKHMTLRYYFKTFLSSCTI